MCRADRCTHTNGAINGSQRCDCTKGVATDVTRNGNTKLIQYIKRAAVRTTRTHNGGTAGDLLLECHKGSGILAKHHLAYHRGGVFAKHCEKLLALDINTHSKASILNKGIELFNHVNSLAFCGKILE